MAIARQQEMAALTREHEALLVLAEARIPQAIATAFAVDSSEGLLVRAQSDVCILNRTVRWIEEVLLRPDHLSLNFRAKLRHGNQKGGRCQGFHVRLAKTEIAAVRTIPVVRSIAARHESES